MIACNRILNKNKYHVGKGLIEYLFENRLTFCNWLQDKIQRNERCKKKCSDEVNLDNYGLLTGVIPIITELNISIFYRRHKW